MTLLCGKIRKNVPSGRVGLIAPRVIHERGKDTRTHEQQKNDTQRFCFHVECIIDQELTQVGSRIYKETDTYRSRHQKRLQT